MGFRKDSTESKFGKLTIIEFDYDKWKCQCDCGGIKFASSGSLQKGEVKLCGCLYGEKISNVGGANKLLKQFVLDYSSEYIRSYSYNDYFIGGIYEILGFENKGQCNPRYYWYFKDKEIKCERCMLKHLKAKYSELLKESYDNDVSNKEDKVYLLGNTKWEWVRCNGKSSIK